MRRIALALLAVSPLLACSDPEHVVVTITTGQETDAFTLDPPIERVDIVALDENGGTVSQTSAAPGEEFSLGEISVDQFLRFEVTGYDAAGDVQLSGQSLGLVLGALESDVFAVFAQRLERWSRPPGGLEHSHRAGIADVLAERYLLLTGGEGLGEAGAAESAFYDLLALEGAVGGTFSLTPSSLVVAQTATDLLVLDGERAYWLDFASNTSIQVTSPPTGIGSWSQVAGGATVIGEDATFVVGPTRLGEPTNRVLRILADGTLEAITLNQARAGAAVAYVPDVGLAIAGGATEGPGVEVVRDGDAQATALDFEALPIVGAAGVVGTQSRELLVLCGGNPVALDLGCSADCQPREVSLAVDPDLTSCRAFASEGGRLVLVGTRASDGLMTSFSIAPASDEVTELPFREPRRGAALTPAPDGTLALLGGELPDGSPALSVELLRLR
ncbi:MAG: hypothetical protein KC731_35715 [Myxococcales bacterium]|nr:hypothetical protein [Myxococcales bacterium]